MNLFAAQNWKGVALGCLGYPPLGGAGVQGSTWGSLVDSRSGFSDRDGCLFPGAV